jgi:hypothetical protein
MCKGCGKSQFGNAAAFQSHRRCCTSNQAYGSDTSISSELISNLRPPQQESSRQQLSDYNLILTTCVEIIAASPQDVQTELTHNRRRRIQLGDVGIRCRACAQAGRYSIGSVKYPDCLEHLVHNIYVMVDRHLLKTCPNISAHEQARLRETKPNSTSQSMYKHRIGLPIYLKMIYQEFGLVNRGNRQGVVCRQSLSTSDKWAAPSLLIDASAAATDDEDDHAPMEEVPEVILLSDHNAKRGDVVVQRASV